MLPFDPQWNFTSILMFRKNLNFFQKYFFDRSKKKLKKKCWKKISKFRWKNIEKNLKISMKKMLKKISKFRWKKCWKTSWVTRVSWQFFFGKFQIKFEKPIREIWIFPKKITDFLKIWKTRVSWQFFSGNLKLNLKKIRKFEI